MKQFEKTPDLVTGLIEMTDSGHSMVSGYLSQAECLSLYSTLIDQGGWRPMVGRVGEVEQIGSALHFDTEPVPDVVCAFSRRLVSEIQASAVLSEDVQFNEAIVNYYPAQVGCISAHRDHTRYRGVIATVTLSGEFGQVDILADRTTTIGTYFPKTGDLLLIRGRLTGDPRVGPMHAVRTAPTEARTSLALRCGPSSFSTLLR